MTEDQIKAIAEEYAKYVNSAYLSDQAEKEALRVVQWLTEHYFIVEKSKVKALQAEIHCTIMNAHNDDDMQMVAHEVLDVMPRRFAAVFGTSMFNQNEE